MNNFSSLLKQQQQHISSLHEIHDEDQMSQYDGTPSPEDFLEQILASVPNSAPSFPWSDDHNNHSGFLNHMEDQSKPRQHHQINNNKAALVLHHQQLMLGRNMEHDHNDVVDGPSFESADHENDASVKSMFNGFNGSLGQTSNQPQHFHHSMGGAMQPQNFGPPMNQPAASGSSGGGTARQPRQRVRAKRGQATDPHSIAERLRRERIAERMKALQELVPNGNKTDKASMLDEIIDYLKFLQLQVKVLSVSRLGGASAVAPLAPDGSSEGRKNGNGTQPTASSNNNTCTGASTMENDVAKLLEEDMGSAMQYLQGKGLCLMPISLASAISAVTRNPLNMNGTTDNPLLNGGEGGPAPTSPSLSGLTVQSATAGVGGGVGRERSIKDVNSTSKS